MQAEDKAVDLYVLERALESTHTQENLMDKVLEGYKVWSGTYALLAGCVEGGGGGGVFRIDACMCCIPDFEAGAGNHGQVGRR